MLHIGLNKPEYNLTNFDIPSSEPNCSKFKTSRQPSNPLNPIYKLAHVEKRPVTPPKFIRDAFDNADIEGAHTKKEKYYETRNTMNLEDIDGAIPK